MSVLWIIIFHLTFCRFSVDHYYYYRTSVSCDRPSSPNETLHRVKYLRLPLLYHLLIASFVDYICLNRSSPSELKLWGGENYTINKLKKKILGSSYFSMEIFFLSSILWCVLLDYYFLSCYLNYTHDLNQDTKAHQDALGCAKDAVTFCVWWLFMMPKPGFHNF